MFSYSNKYQNNNTMRYKLQYIFNANGYAPLDELALLLMERNVHFACANSSFSGVFFKIIASKLDESSFCFTCI